MIYKFIKMKYEEVDICFISHSTIAKRSYRRGVFFIKLNQEELIYQADIKSTRNNKIQNIILKYIIYIYFMLVMEITE